MRFVWLVPCFWHGKKPLNFNVCTVYSACCSVNHGQKCGLHWQQEGIRQPHTARPAMLRAEAYDLGDPQLNRCWNLGWEATGYHISNGDFLCRHQVLTFLFSGHRVDGDRGHSSHSMGTGFYPMVITNSLLLNMAIEIVTFPMKHGGSFHSELLNYQRLFPVARVFKPNQERH